LNNNYELKDMPLKAQATSVILHPSQLVITLKANTNENADGQFIQIFNLDKKKKINS